MEALDYEMGPVPESLLHEALEILNAEDAHNLAIAPDQPSKE